MIRFEHTNAFPRLLSSLMVRRFLRHESFKMKLAAKVLLVLFVVFPIAVNIALLGFLLESIVAHAFPGADVVAMVNERFVFVLMLLTLAVSFKAASNVPLQPYLTLPVSKAGLSHCFQIISFFNLLNLGAALFALAYWIRSILPIFSPLQAFTWLVAMALLLSAGQLGVNLLRQIRFKHTSGYVLAVLSMLALLLLELHPAVSLLQVLSSAWLGGALRGVWYAPGSLMLVVCALYLLSFKSTIRALYVDATSGHGTQRKTQLLSAYTFGNPFYSFLVQLVIRSPRVRNGLFGMSMLTIFGALKLILGLKAGSLMETGLGIIFLMSFVGIGFSVHAFRYLSTSFDGISSWPVSYRSVSRTILIFTCVWTTIVYLFALPFMLLSASNGLALFFAVYLYAIGMVNFAYVYVASYDRSRFDPSLSAFSMNGVAVTNPLLNMFCSVSLAIAPVALLLWAGDPLALSVVLPLGALGALGLAFSRKWLALIERNLEARKYERLAGFRT